MYSPIERWVTLEEWKDKNDNSWQAELLQCKYFPGAVPPSRIRFTRWVKSKRQKTELVEEALNQMLQDKVIELKSLYPEDFYQDRFGYFSNGKLYELWEQGKVEIKGWSLEQYREEIVKVEQARRLEKQRQAEIARAAQEQKDKEYQESLVVLEEAREKVVVGMFFKTKPEIVRAYKEAVEAKVLLMEGKKIHITAKRAREETATFVTIREYKTQNGWEVLEVLQEGGRKWDAG